MNPYNYTAGFVVVVVAGLLIYAWRRQSKTNRPTILEDIKQIVYENQLKLNKVMATFEETIAKLDRIEASHAGIKEDIAYLKTLAEQNPGGFTAAQVEELNARLDSVESGLAATDSETDSDGEEEQP